MAVEQSPRLGVALRDPLPWPDLVEVAATVEDTGYEALLVPEVAWREAFSTLAGLAAATERVQLGTGIAPIENRTARATAMAAATLHEMSRGRFLLGLGAGQRSLEELQRYAAEVRSAMPATGLVEREGPPVWFAALGDRAVDLAARAADGVLLNWCTPERVARARETVERTRGDLSAFTIAVYVRCCLQATGDAEMLDALARAAATYAAIPHYRRQFDAMGLEDEAAAASWDPTATSERAGDAVARLVDAVCIRGGREAFVRRARDYADAGADVIVVYPVVVHDPLSSLLGTLMAAAPSPAVER